MQPPQRPTATHLLGVLAQWDAQALQPLLQLSDVHHAVSIAVQRPEERLVARGRFRVLAGGGGQHEGPQPAQHGPGEVTAGCELARRDPDGEAWLGGAAAAEPLERRRGARLLAHRNLAGRRVWPPSCCSGRSWPRPGLAAGTGWARFPPPRNVQAGGMGWSDAGRVSALSEAPRAKQSFASSSLKLGVQRCFKGQVAQPQRAIGEVLFMFARRMVVGNWGGESIVERSIRSKTAERPFSENSIGHPGGRRERRGDREKRVPSTAHRETLAPSAQDKCDSEVRHTVQMRHSFEDNGRNIDLQREGPRPDPQLRNSKDGM